LYTINQADNTANLPLITASFLTWGNILNKLKKLVLISETPIPVVKIAEF
jgi:hypothetical protein